MKNDSKKTAGNKQSRISSIRLSLTFRIALHYVLQLIRTVIPIMLIMTVLFCFGLSIPVFEDLHRITGQPLEEGQTAYTQDVILNPRLQVETTNLLPKTDFLARVTDQFRLIFSAGLIAKSEPHLCFLYTAPDGLDFLVTVMINDYRIAWFWMLLGIIISDGIRIISFLRRSDRLNRHVLAPIRDITEMAATLSESNLSNRINIAGTKNELKDLAQVINTMLDRIERSYNSQKQFVSDASHELRTPIAVIRGYTDMLRRWGKEDPRSIGRRHQRYFHRNRKHEGSGRKPSFPGPA